MEYEKKKGKKNLLRCRRFSSYKRSGNYVGKNTWSNELYLSFSRAVKLHGVRLLADVGVEYKVKLEVLSQSVRKRFHALRDSRGIDGFDVMLPRPIDVQANVFVHLKVAIRGRRSTRVGGTAYTTAETDGITVKFCKFLGMTSSNMPANEHDVVEEIIFEEV